MSTAADISTERLVERFYVMPEMKELVDAGNLGAKTGKGFYEHGN